jgi:hypothetical protein
MDREIDAVHTRCRTCGTATWLVVRSQFLDDAGELVVIIQPEEVPHSRADCERFTRLERETWPTLW